MKRDPLMDEPEGIEVRKIDLDPKKEGSPAGRKHNMELSIAAWIFVVLFALLIGRVVFINVFEAESLRNNLNNTKADSNSENVIRGDIRTLDGTVLATTLVDENANQTRSYPFDNVFAHVVGYASNGKSGLEAEENYSLMSSHSSLLQQIRAQESGEKVQGDRVIVTLDAKLQQTAYYALGSYSGAVVVMEPDTGRILAMVSKPDFNPNTIGIEWENLVSDSSSSALLNRATQGLYPPGSTFKMITTLGYLRAHPKDYAGIALFSGHRAVSASEAETLRDMAIWVLGSTGDSYAIYSIYISPTWNNVRAAGDKEKRRFTSCSSAPQAALIFNHNMWILAENDYSAEAKTEYGGLSTVDGAGKRLYSPSFISWFTQWSAADESASEAASASGSVWQRIVSFFRTVIALFTLLLG